MEFELWSSTIYSSIWPLDGKRVRTKKKDPSRDELMDARERLAALIAKRGSDEGDFQALLSECPYVLKRGLPVRMDFAEIVARGRPGKEETDFLFYPRKHPVPYYSFGAIELKRPDTQILVAKRKNLIQLSADAQTAILQAKKDGKKLEKQLIGARKDVVLLEGDLHLFAILGLKEEIAGKLGSRELRAQYQALLPVNTRVIPYDQLLQAYESTIPRRLCIIRPEAVGVVLTREGEMPPGFIASSKSLLANVNSGTPYVELYVFEHVSASARELLKDILPALQSHCSRHSGTFATEPNMTFCLIPVLDVTETSLVHQLMRMHELQFGGRRRRGRQGMNVGRLAKQGKLNHYVDVAITRYPDDGAFIEQLFKTAREWLHKLKTEVIAPDADSIAYEGY